MELVEIEMIGAESFERTFEFFSGTVFGTILGFASEEGALAVGLESGAEAILGITVAGGNVEIVDATIEGFRDEAVGGFLRFVHNGDSAQGDNGEVYSSFAETALGDGWEIAAGNGERAGVGESGSGGGGLEEIAPKHEGTS